jgi:hypothetical protein
LCARRACMRVCEWRASSVRGHMRTSVRAYSAFCLGGGRKCCSANLERYMGSAEARARRSFGTQVRHGLYAEPLSKLSLTSRCRRPTVGECRAFRVERIISADRLRRFARWSEANRARPEVSASPCRADVFTQPCARRCAQGTRSTANATSNEKTGSQPVIPVRVDQVAIQTPPGSLTPAA